MERERYVTALEINTCKHKVVGPVCKVIPERLGLVSVFEVLLGASSSAPRAP